MPHLLPLAWVYRGWHTRRMTTQPDYAHAVVPAWTLGDRLRKIRLTAGMDQRSFAGALGVTASRIASWETDRATPRDLVTLAKRVELLTRVPATWLLGLDAEHPRPGGPDGGDVVRHQGLEPRTR